MCEKKRTKQHYCCSALFLHCLSGYGDIMFYCLINENRTVSELFYFSPKLFFARFFCHFSTAMIKLLTHKLGGKNSRYRLIPAVCYVFNYR